MKKTLVIGLGGTGLAVIHELRRLVAKRYELGLQSPEVAAVKFLYIDTHENDLTTYNWSVLGKDIRLTEGEKVIIMGDRLQAMVESPEDYPDVSPWLPSIRNYIGDPGNGAKGIRPYGRLIYEYNENKRDVRAKCTDCYNSLNAAFNHIPDWRFYLIAGLSGGTGSGMFLPLSFDLHEWDLYQRGYSGKKFYSFLVVPPLQVVGRHDRYHPNAYAALNELNYYAFQPEQIPFDNCYLLEPQNAIGLQVGLENLPLLIAQRLFLNIQDGSASNYIDAIMDNPNLGEVEDDSETGRRHSLRFSTFGLSTVSYPREVVAQSLALTLAERVVAAWISEKAYSKNINEQVRAELKNIRLSRAHVYGDADPFGINDFIDHSVEINNLVDENLQSVIKGQLGSSLDKIRRNLEEGFRSRGIREFFAQREKDVTGAVSEAVKHLQLKITSFLRSSELGLAYSKQFLDELIKILEDEFKKDVSGMTSDRAENRIRTFRENLADLVSLIRTNEHKFLYSSGAFQKDRANASDELKHYLKAFANFQSGKYGIVFLERAIPQIRSLRAALDVWEKRTYETWQALTGKRKTILDDIQKGTKENGKTIFSQTSLDALAQQISPSIIQSSIEEVIKSNLGQESFDLIALTNVSKKEPEDIVYEAAYQWVISDRCPVDVKRLTLYDKFVTEYSSSEQRQKTLSEAKVLSAPFLKFAPSEVGKKPVQSLEAFVTTIPDGTGRVSNDGRPTQIVFQSDIEAIGIPAERIKLSDDQERIIFLQEKQVFPLRLIESLGRLRASYDKFSEKPALHIDRRVEPYLYDLYLLSSEEKKNLLEAEEVFVTSQAYGWLELKVNQFTHKEEVRYEFNDPEQMGLRKLVLSSDWENARELLVGDVIASNSSDSDVRRARELLTLKYQRLIKQAKTSAEGLKELKELLGKHLQEIAAKSPAGIDDPAYERDRKIINRVINSFK